jgi:predicted nucleic acid-binding protein
VSFILDTCVVSELSKPKPAPRVLEWFNQCPPGLLYLSVLTLGELHFGVARLPEGKKKNDLVQWLEELQIAYQGYVLPLNHGTCIRWGTERARLEKLGQPAPVIDSLLAASAHEHDFTLVTRNIVNFRMFGIKLLNPWSSTNRPAVGYSSR